MNSDIAGEKLFVRDIELEFSDSISANDVVTNAVVTLIHSFAYAIESHIVIPRVSGYEVKFDTEICGLNMKLVMRVYGK